MIKAVLSHGLAQVIPALMYDTDPSNAPDRAWLRRASSFPNLEKMRPIHLFTPPLLLHRPLSLPLGIITQAVFNARLND